MRAKANILLDVVSRVSVVLERRKIRSASRAFINPGSTILTLHLNPIISLISFAILIEKETFQSCVFPAAWCSFESRSYLFACPDSQPLKLGMRYVTAALHAEEERLSALPRNRDVLAALKMELCALATVKSPGKMLFVLPQDHHGKPVELIRDLNSNITSGQPSFRNPHVRKSSVIAPNSASFAPDSDGSKVCAGSAALWILRC